MKLKLNVFTAIDPMENTIIVERVYLDDEQLKPQTIAHHLARYEFAVSESRDLWLKLRVPMALDLACGSGYGTNILAQYFAGVMGLDINKEAIDYARKTFTGKPWFLVEDIRNYKTEATYHLITFFEAIEHLSYSDGKELLKKITKMLIGNGMFILSTPRENNGKYNTFHKSEWSYDLLKNELGSVFKEVRIYGQDWDTAKISSEHVKENDFYICVCK